MSNAPAPEPLYWVKSSYSGGQGQCVEWAPDHAATTGEFKVRDSKDPHGPHLTLTAGAFTGLVTFAKSHG
ncbi:DUF397 domain-containing protein [Streptomyces catenulae]|uniref:DUF397 domain-containing protein n=1 Tax=Streptomyces catenulae TaxID=66875 RepID=A0ABV2Z8T8_9ACTN|nr:DUF397 domain-containing protein [Streptomyces catenulae]